MNSDDLSGYLIKDLKHIKTYANNRTCAEITQGGREERMCHVERNRTQGWPPSSIVQGGAELHLLWM